MNLYAKGTTVSVGKTQADIRKLVEKYRGQWVGVVTDHEQVRPIDALAFRLAGLPIRFNVLHPRPNDPEVKGYNLEKAIEAEYKRRWREVWLIVKSRLIEAVQLKRDVKEVFMPQLVTKTGQTLWEMSQKNMSSLVDGSISLGAMLQLPEGGLS